MGTKSGQNFQNLFFPLFSQRYHLSLVCGKKNTKYLFECGIRLNPNSLLKPNRERCDNPEFSCRVLRFFHGFSSAIFICIFLWHLELHLTVKINLSHIPKQREIGVFMKWPKREVAVREICETGRTTEISSRKFWWSGKPDLALCFFGWCFFASLNLFVFPGGREMTFRAKGSGSLCLRQDFWDRHATNVATCWEAIYGERLFRRPNKRLSGEL